MPSRTHATKKHAAKATNKRPGKSSTSGATQSGAAASKTPPAPSPIEHVVVLMLENRSFDHVFGYRHGVDGLKGDEFNLADPSKPESDTNPAYHVSNGAPYAVLAGEGPGHSFAAANVQLCNSKNGPGASSPALNNGFVSNYNTELVYADKVKNPSREVVGVVMESFAPSRLPSINALADAFCVCDNWYSEVPGPTQPNRLYMQAATSFGYALNVWSQIFDGPTIYNRLQDAGHTWACYYFDDNDLAEFSQVNTETANMKLYDESFASDVKAGALPTYTFIEPRFNNAKDAMANSQHAPQDARYGDNFVADVYETLRANDALWMKTALIVTYDEHGGFYDHVVPPSEGIPNPDGINSPPPGNQVSYAPVFAFDRLGFRVPAVIASPWVKAGRVDSTRYQHTSVLATLKKMFGWNEFLTKRDASANTFEHLFSELDAPRADTPATLPRAPLPQVTAATDDPAHPANQPLDATQKDVLLKAYHLTRSTHPDGPSPDNLPTTQGEASTFIRERYRRHFQQLGDSAKKSSKKTSKKSSKKSSKKTSKKS
ncbi:MAG TPA: alkaline phosphatase family protein [Pyrinomonadaceae bacterium]|nr:alkaline phosphatase family protein [Pyrinomonadaceae bacterium]